MFSRAVATVVPLAASLLLSVPDQRKALSAGEWGGEQVSLSVTEKGARLELACAHGSIETAILVDGEGHFDVTGVYVREGPGPVRVDEEGGEPARFSGRIEQDVMTLTLERTSKAGNVGPFKLEKGRPSRIRKCQ